MATVRSIAYGVIFALFLFSTSESFALGTSGNTNATTPPLSAVDALRVQKLTTAANQSLDSGDLDDALASVDSALQLDTHNALLYELRGTIYIQQKLWDRAENDYQSALQINPTDVSFKYKLAEIKFLQKAYASARQGYLALENDPALGELAKYHVFLCDIFDFDDPSARRDLDALNGDPEKHQAYYFCNAVWDLFHKDRQGANNWIISASRLYSSADMDLYLSSLKNSNNLNAPTVTFTTEQGITYKDAKVFVEDDGLRISTATGWITVPFAQLPSDLSSFPADLRKDIEKKENPSPSTEIDTASLSFTTKDGKKYDQVKWSVAEEGLRVLTSDGWITVPFEKLPDDLSHFPAEAQTQISVKQKEAKDKAAAASTPDAETNTSPVVNSPSANLTPRIESSPLDLHPAAARDCSFGTCVALEGNIFAVGTDGATYIYEHNVLKARLCPEADSTQTGDLVTSISLSNQTLVTSTRRGVYVWIGTAQGWKLQTRLDVSNASTVALDGDNLVVATNGGGVTGNVIAFYTRKGDTWQPVPRSINRDGSCYSADLFGHLVALKKNVALIGNPNWNKDADNNRGPEYSGRVFVEKFDGQTWNEEAQLASTEATVGANQFGQSVSLADDLIAVSSTNRDNIDYAPHHGVVHVFQRAADAWTKRNTLHGPDPANDAGFGGGPLVFSQHTLAIVDLTLKAHVARVTLDNGTNTGSPGEIKQAGAVYVYENQVLQDTLMAPDPADSLQQTGSPDQFGSSLALSGGTLLVGAPGKDGGTGAVYVWKRQNNHWHLDTELKGFHKQATFNY